MVLRTYNVMVVGAGGREHALCWKLAQSSLVAKIYCAPGNGGTATEEKTTNVDIAADDVAGLLAFAKENDVYLTVVGPEAPLAQGIVDAFEAEKLKIFGPTQAQARLEASKAYAKAVLRDLNIPTADFGVFDNKVDALTFCHANDWARVIKVDGLAAGKGVMVCDSVSECEHALAEVFDNQRFGESGRTVVIEERLNGPEISLMVLCDGKFLLPMASSQDYKRRFDNNAGPNTGGMGAFSPVPSYQELQPRIQQKILDPLQAALDAGTFSFKGLLYIGLMIQDNQPYVLEFNVRFGDPETQCLLPRLENDFFMILEACTLSCLYSYSLFWQPKVAVGTVLSAEGYPEVSSKGVPITIGQPNELVKVFHAGTRLDDQQQLVTNGGRIFNVVALGETYDEARLHGQQAIGAIHFDGKAFRTDIGAGVGNIREWLKELVCPSVS
ncbi:MAG: phosphoribosylamine--glycine ligase [Cyanobacteria bacterium HKST-UBA04]|nr:phosphoribosylamine--glycine ligase [Cyanobacteria bacterium HKST-UBA04]